MSDVLLISPNTYSEPYPVYPLGMASMAAALRAHGHRVGQFDLLAAKGSTRELLDTICSFQPHVVGISIRNIDTTDSTDAEKWSLYHDRTLIRAVREVTPAPIVLGGPAFSIMPEAMLDYLGADHGVAGEGEDSFPALIKDIEAGTTKGGIYRMGDGSFADPNRNHPLWQDSLVSTYVNRGGAIGVQTKRGCMYDCAYCPYPAIEGGNLRCKDPGAVADEVERLAMDLGVRFIFFTDSIFNEPQSNYLSIAEELIQRDIRVEWSAFFRPQAISREEILLLKRSGLSAIEVGTDAASDAALSGLNKGFGFSDAIAFNDACAREKIPCIHYIMFGCPGESMETVAEGLDNLGRLKDCVVLAFSGIRVLPGTSLHGRAIADGVLSCSNDLLRPAFYYSPAIDIPLMHERIRQSFGGRRDRLFPPSRANARLRILNTFGFRGFLWTKLLSGQ